MPTQLEDLWNDHDHYQNQGLGDELYDLPAKYTPAPDPLSPKSGEQTVSTDTSDVAIAAQDTQVAVVDSSEKAIAAFFDISEAAISELSEKYYDLKIAGIDDNEGFDAVHKARMHVKDLRTQVDKKHRELKAPVLERGRAIDAEKKRIKLLLLPVYQRLESTEMEIVNEKDRLKRVEAEKKAAELKRRIAAMQAVEWIAPVDVIEPMTDAEFLAAWTIAKKAYDTRKATESQQAAELAAKEADLQRRERELKEAEAKLFPNKETAPESPEPCISKELTDREKLEVYMDAIASIPQPQFVSANNTKFRRIISSWMSDLSDLLNAL